MSTRFEFKIKEIEDLEIDKEQKTNFIRELENFLNSNKTMILYKITEEQLNQLVQYGKMCQPEHFAAYVLDGFVFRSQPKIAGAWHSDDIKIVNIDVNEDFIDVDIELPTGLKFRLWTQYCEVPSVYWWNNTSEKVIQKLSNIKEDEETFYEIRKIYLEMIMTKLPDKLRTFIEKKIEETIEKTKEEIIQELTHQNEEEEEEDEEDEEDEVQYP